MITFSTSLVFSVHFLSCVINLQTLDIGTLGFRLVASFSLADRNRQSREAEVVLTCFNKQFAEFCLLLLSHLLKLLVQMDDDASDSLTAS